MNYKDISSSYIKKTTKSGESRLTTPVKGVDAVNNSLQNIIATSKGTVPGHPEFGCGIDKYIFELIDPFIQEMIKAEIEYAVERWEPRCVIQDVEVISDPDYNRILIRIIYKIRSDVQSNQHEYIYKQSLN